MGWLSVPHWALRSCTAIVRTPFLRKCQVKTYISVVWESALLGYSCLNWTCQVVFGIHFFFGSVAALYSTYSTFSILLPPLSNRIMHKAAENSAERAIHKSCPKVMESTVWNPVSPTSSKSAALLGPWHHQGYLFQGWNQVQTPTPLIPPSSALLRSIDMVQKGSYQRIMNKRLGTHKAQERANTKVHALDLILNLCTMHCICFDVIVFQ